MNVCSSLEYQVMNDFEEKIPDDFIVTNLLNFPVFENSSHFMSYYGKTLHIKIHTEEDLSLDALSLTSTPIGKGSKKLKVVGENCKITLRKDSKRANHRNKIFIGGVEKETKLIMDSLQTHKKFKALIYGVSGVGKTLFAQNLLRQFGQDFKSLSASDMFSQFSGETCEALTKIFAENSTIFIDEFDILTVNSTQEERRISACLQNLLDDFEGIFLATTSRVESIDANFRRRFEMEVEIPIPNYDQRKSIVQVLCQKLGCEITAEDLEYLSRNAHGYVGSDLEAVLNSTEPTLVKSMKSVKPSAMREIQVQVPNVTWEEIGGLDNLKLQLKQAIEWPIKRPEVFAKMGISPPKGVLMYGPPGCSKTMIAKALANESHLNFVAIKGPELFKKYVGESEQAVRELFKKARRVSPCIIFFDEIDALGSERGGNSSKVGDRVLAQMLTEMDGIEQLKDVVIVAATNRPDMIDKALMRPGRLDKLVYVPLPDRDTRLKIFQIHTRKKPLEDSVDLEKLADLTQDYSGAEIAAVCNEAALATLENIVENTDGNLSISQKNFDDALNKIKPRLINSKLLSIYEKFRHS